MGRPGAFHTHREPATQPVEALMSKLTCRVDTALLEQFPGYMRGVIWAEHVSNDESPFSMTTLLEDEAFYQPLAATRLAEHPRITCWQQAYAALDPGSSGRGVRLPDIPPFARLAERVLARGRLPLSTIVQDAAAILSLWHLVPVAAYALDALREGLTLRFAVGHETPACWQTAQRLCQHAAEIEPPSSGELIMTDAMRVVTRGWNRFQMCDTRVTCATTAVALVVDALPVIQLTELKGICEEGVSLLETFCGASAHYAILSDAAPTTLLN